MNIIPSLLGMSDGSAPLARATDDRKIGWLKEIHQDGMAYLDGQRSSQDSDMAVEIIYGTLAERNSSKLSRIKTNPTKRQIREVVATLANIRPIPNFSTDNFEQFGKGANMLNKMFVAWWYGTNAYWDVRGSIQYAAVQGRGWLCPTWEKDYWTFGRGDIKLHPYGPKDVIPFQVPRNHDIQRTYAVSIHTEMPIMLAKTLYPLAAHKLVPSRNGGGIAKGIRRVQKFLSPVLQRFGAGGSGRTEEVNFPVVDIYDTYIMDMTVNMGPSPVPVGEPGTNWFRLVYPLGSVMPNGNKATREDALLYPFRRRILSAPDSDCIISDDGSPWWHGKVPAVPVDLDSWVFEMLGLSLVRDVASIHQSNNEMYRVIEDSMRVRLRPPMKYDSNVIAQTDMERLDLRQEGLAVDMNMQQGDGLAPILNPAQFDVPAWIFEHIKNMDDKAGWLIGVQDLIALAKARQMPAEGTLDKMLEIAGPLVTDMSRGLETSVNCLGEMWKALAFQFYTAPRRVQWLGEDGITEHDLDWEPGFAVPSHMEEEDQSRPSVYSQSQRAKAFKDKYIFRVTPNSLHQITQMSRKLLVLQLWRAQFPLDPWTVAEHLDIPNFGPAPKGTSNVMERWVAWRTMQIEQTADAQIIMAQLLQASGLGGMMGAAGAPQPSEAVAGGGPNRPVGRPPTAQVAPHLEQKDRGARSTISES